MFTARRNHNTLALQPSSPCPHSPAAPPLSAHPRRMPPDAPYGQSRSHPGSHEAPAPQPATVTAVDPGRGAVGRATTGRRRGPPRPGRLRAVGRGRFRRGQRAGRAPRARRGGGCGPDRAACASNPLRPPRRVVAAPSSGRFARRSRRRSAHADPATLPLSLRRRLSGQPAATALPAGAMDDGARQGGVLPGALSSRGALRRRRPRGGRRRLGPPLPPAAAGRRREPAEAAAIPPAPLPPAVPAAARRTQGGRRRASRPR